MDREGFFKSRDGQQFYERRWEPEGAVRAHVVILHGYGEHCSRYAAVAGALNAAGFAVHTYDQRGFGRSAGKRAYIRCFDALLDDLDDYLEHVRPRFQDKPWFVLSHSMGGLVLASYVETRNLDARGLVFSSPFLAFHEDVPKWLVALAGVLGTVTPWLPVSAVDNTSLSRDPEAVQEADSDPLSYHGSVKARTGAQFHAAIRRAQAGFERIVAPLYIIHGSEDKLVPASGSRLLYERCRSEDKTLKIYEGGYHELWNDIVKDEVIAGIADWLASRV